jgi:hypothetical protein
MKNRINPAPKASKKPEGKTAAKSRNGRHQVASGDLKATDQAQAPLLTKSTGPVGVGLIQHFPLIPDFRTRTAAPHPIVMSTPSKGCFCIDGWEMVERAREQDRPSIVCEIIHVSSDSETEIALHKAAVRSMPPGGTCSHAEMVANTVLLLGMLMESGEKLEVFSHGGARRGTGFIKVREEDVITVLVERLGRSRKSILKNLQHGEYLNEQALHAAIEADVPKGFFEAVQQGKAALVSDLKAAKRSEAEIVEVVSAKILVWLKEATTPVPKEISPSDNPQVVQTTEEKASRSSQPSKASEFTHWAGNEAATSEPTIDEGRVRSEIRGIGTELVRLSESPDLISPEQVQAVQELTVQLSRLTAYLCHLSNQSGVTKEGRSNG